MESLSAAQREDPSPCTLVFEEKNLSLVHGVGVAIESARHCHKTCAKMQVSFSNLVQCWLTVHSVVPQETSPQNVASYCFMCTYVPLDWIEAPPPPPPPPPHFFWFFFCCPPQACEVSLIRSMSLQVTLEKL